MRNGLPSGLPAGTVRGGEVTPVGRPQPRAPTTQPRPCAAPMTAPRVLVQQRRLPAFDQGDELSYKNHGGLFRPHSGALLHRVRFQYFIKALKIRLPVFFGEDPFPLQKEEHHLEAERQTRQRIRQSFVCCLIVVL